MNAPAPLLALRGLDKRFTGTHALRGVDLDFAAGEIHAIVGENGAGKSTLIKLMTGAYERSAGTMLWEGREVTLGSPHEASVLGIDAVHQEMVLCRHLTVAANMFLGDERTRFGLLDHRGMVRETQRILDDLGFVIPAGVVLERLTIGQQQLVAAARATLRGGRLLILDEPTAYLTRDDATRLFALIRRLHAQGRTIVYISHRLEEIFELAERVSVLRDGRLVATRVVAETNERELIRDMVARPLEEVHPKASIAVGAPLLEVQGLSGPGFEDVSITVRQGEIVGLYGLIGAGRSEFVQCLYGRQRRRAGTVRMRGKLLDVRREADAIAEGIVLLPESRRDQGLCLNLGVAFNLALPIFHRLSRAGIVLPRAERVAADRQIADLRIVTSSRNVEALTLSGGNQQKLVIGKWLAHGADLFIFDEPTVGVDVGTKEQIYRILADLLRNGAGIVLISSYLPEVYDLADTVHVFRRGRIVATHAHGACGHETILSEAIGA